MSPQRSKSHVMEDRSRRKFESILPDEWVYRDLPKDYGVDAEVEVFENGRSTSLTFKVQLKSVAISNGSEPKVKVKLSHLSYWNRLEVPILVVLDVQETGQMYAKWAVTHDPGIDSERKRWTTIHFNKGDLLPEIIHRIPNDVLMLRDLKHGLPWPTLPIQIDFQLHDPSLEYDISDYLRRVIPEIRSVRAAEPSEPCVVITIGQRLIRAALPLNAGSYTLHTDSRGLEPSQVGANALLVLAVLLVERREEEKSLELFSAAWPDTPAILADDISIRLIAALITTSKPDMALDLIDALRANGVVDDFEKLNSLLLPGIVHAAALSNDRLESLIGLLVDMLAKTETLELQRVHARLALNLANVLRARERYSEANRYLAVAMSKFDGYAKNPSLWDIAGGSLFREGRFLDSADAYQRALDLGGPNMRTSSHLADALLWSGRYERALAIVRPKDSAPLTDSLSVINGILLHEIVNELGIGQQDRVIAPLESSDTNFGSREEAENHLKTLDALSTMAWLSLLKEHASLAVAAAACRVTLTVPELWVNLVLMAETLNATEELDSFIQLALANTGGAFVRAMRSACDASPEELKFSKVMDRVYEKAQKLDEPQDAMLMLIDGEPIAG